MPSSSTFAQRLLILQSFKETVWGTSGVATAKWMGTKPYPEFTPFRKSTVFDEARGSLAPGFLSAILQKGGEYTIPGYATYEDMIMVAHNFFAIVSPTGSTPYVYTYPAYTTSSPNIQSYTFEFGQVGSFVKATGCIGNKLQIKGVAAEQWEYSLSGFAQDVDTTASGSPAALADRTVEVAVMPVTSVWIDPSGSTIGTTAFLDALVDFSLDMENSLKPIYTAGSQVPTQWVAGDKFKSSLSISLLWTSAIRTFINTTLATGAGGLFRLKATSGTKYIQIDFAGVLADNYKLFGEKEGAQMVQLKLDAKYDTGAALSTTLSIGNAVSAVP